MTKAKSLIEQVVAGQEARIVIREVTDPDEIDMRNVQKAVYNWLDKFSGKTLDGARPTTLEIPIQNPSKYDKVKRVNIDIARKGEFTNNKDAESIEVMPEVTEKLGKILNRLLLSNPPLGTIRYKPGATLPSNSRRVSFRYMGLRNLNAPTFLYKDTGS